MPTPKHRLRATVTYTSERDLTKRSAPARVEAYWMRSDLEHDYPDAGPGATRTVKVEVVR